ncbi:MAG: YciI family protein [Woeseiaceae bacterium]|nr:YciI family protein [Woeseiaceae bacterium]
MSKYLFVYHGGSNPETEEEVAEVLDAWGNWLGSMGAAVVDGGNPVGMSSTVHPGGKVEDNGGSNPVSGYGLFEAADLDDALAKAKGCPILAAGGSVELAEVIDM